MTRLEQREGRHLRPELRGRSTRQRHDTLKTTRLPLTPRISRRLHTPASRRAVNSERFGTYAQNVKNAPRASGKQRDGRHLRTYAQNFGDAPRASVTTCGKQREGRYLRPEFRGRSTRQRHDLRKTKRGSPLTPRISRTRHATASRSAENSKRFATYAQNFKDAPRASGKQREGRYLRPESPLGEGIASEQNESERNYTPPPHPPPSTGTLKAIKAHENTRAGTSGCPTTSLMEVVQTVVLFFCGALQLFIRLHQGKSNNPQTGV